MHDKIDEQVLKKPCILIVDDMPENLLVLTSLLKKLNCNITQAASGQEALDYYQTNKFACILLDVQMPGMPGFELAKEIEKLDHERKTPILFISAAYQEDTAILEGYESGAVDFILKPINPVILLAKVKIFIQFYQEHEKNTQLLVEQKKLSSKLEKLALYDPLTNIYNRRQFWCYADEVQKSALRYHDKFALVLIDIDNFKTINDKYGHDIGDALLIELTERLKKATRETEIIARLGGDEFAIIIPRFNEISNVTLIAKKIIQSINEPNQIANTDIKASISIGIACFPDVGRELNELYKKADFALYHAKQMGKNNFQFFNSELNDKHQTKENIAFELKSALKNNEFNVVYQPVIRISDKNIVGCEALLRWHNKKLGKLLTKDFIDIAEATQDIIRINQWMRPIIFEQYQKWQSLYQLKEFGLSMNISLAELQRPDFHLELNNQIEKYNIPKKQLIVELTESIFSSNQADINQSLNLLRNDNIEIAIDDFGSAGSSLSQIIDFTEKYLKIDRTLIKNICTQIHNEKFINLTLEFAKYLNINIIAKGVENKNQHDMLASLKCAYGQGYYYYKPLSAEEFSKVLEKNDK